MLAGDRFADDVRDDERRRAARDQRRADVRLDRRIGVAGAQPPDALLDLLRTGWEQQTTVAP